MALPPNEQDDQASQLANGYEQRWQAHLDYELRTRLELESSQQQEQAKSYLHEINFTERALLRTRHQEERKTLLHQHRELRIALRKNQQ